MQAGTSDGTVTLAGYQMRKSPFQSYSYRILIPRRIKERLKFLKGWRTVRRQGPVPSVGWDIALTPRGPVLV